MTEAVHTDKPTGTGYFWMRWRRKWQRCWWYDVVWASEAAGDQVREGLSGQPISNFPLATFCGPLEPPEPSSRTQENGQNIPGALEGVDTVETIVAKLPHTGDGVPVVPGMTVWYVRPYSGVTRYVIAGYIHGEGRDVCYPESWGQRLLFTKGLHVGVAMSPGVLH